MDSTQKRQRLAIIGSGISGLSAAYYLQHHFDVHLFERESRLGGHSRTISFTHQSGREIDVDTGFIVLNDQTYPLLNQLFDELSLELTKTEMSFSVASVHNGLEWSSEHFFAQRHNLLNVPIQTITVADELYEAYRKTSDYIRHYIFPGGMLSSKSLFIAEANRCGLVVSNLFEFGQDYAWTLRQWLENFHHAKSELQSMGYSTPFIRGWEFYLAECIAVFSSQRTNVMQVELSHG